MTKPKEGERWQFVVEGVVSADDPKGIFIKSTTDASETSYINNMHVKSHRPVEASSDFTDYAKVGLDYAIGFLQGVRKQF